MKPDRLAGMVMVLVVCTASLMADEGTGPPAPDDTFTISTSYNNLLSNLEGTGLLDLLMKEVFSRLGIEMRIIYTQTDKSVYDVNSGLIDAELNRIAGFETVFPNLIQVPESNMTMHFVAFSKKPLALDETGGWESLRPLYLGLVKGWKILEDNTQGFPHVTVTPTETELFRMLDKDRLDAALYAKMTGYAVLQAMGIQGVRHIEPPLASRDMFLYVHNSHKDLVHDIARTIRQIKEDGSYDAFARSAYAEALGTRGESGAGNSR
ncbi:MAG: transporter substrate-binding domain-containing protein [Spirochaetales bacterium]|nr:transporter substrate-binding domain-containing protein [Spirochaetales bacterium]